MAGAVGGGAGALHRGAFAEFGGMAAKRALIDLACFGARERHAVMLKLVNRLGRFAGEVFHRVGIAKPVRALDRVIHMPLPAVGAHVAKAGGNAALCRYGVAPGREDLGHTGGAQALLGHPQGRAKPGAPGPHYNDVIIMCFVFVSGHGQFLKARSWQGRKARLRSTRNLVRSRR